MQAAQTKSTETRRGATALGRVATTLMIGALMALLWQGFAQEVVIQSLGGNGVLTWSNSVVGGSARVEWVPALGEPWRPSWELLTDISITNHVTAAPVPMFYRVVCYPRPVPATTNVSAAVAFPVLTNRFGDADFIVLDVRTPSEYSGGHVKTALNVNYYSVAFEQTLMKLERNRIYLVYCGSGTRSRLAADVMRRLDFLLVYNLTDGYSVLAARPGAGAYVE